MSNIPLGIIGVRIWNPILLLTVVSNDQPAVRIDLSGTGVNRVFFHPGEVRLDRSGRPDIEAPVELLAPVADGGVGSAAPLDDAGGVVATGGRVADAGARGSPLPRERRAVVAARQIGNGVTPLSVAHVGDLCRSLPQRDAEVARGCTRRRSRPRKSHHRHRNNSNRNERGREFAQKSFMSASRTY